MLFAVELVLCLRYFRRTSRPLVHKIGVGALVLFDTLCTMAVCSSVFLTFLVDIHEESFSKLAVPTTLSIMLTYLAASVEQLFLCHLYFVIAGAILCAVADILIAACLGYEFFKIKINCASPQGLIQRIFILILTSGAIVAGNTLLMMILFLQGSIAFEFFFSCQGRIYALTLLENFLSGPSSTRIPSDSSAKMQSSLAFRVDPFPGKPSSVLSRHSNYSEASLFKELPPLPEDRPHTTSSP
ncbi:hypothetical protein B0H10DRAFT_1944516 [Mycena sp. CBHHK59/15]|nr:hypothetical protein B0H10DRAFT_1944516 [Mycena sp. CBHHK59/15]